MLIPLVRETRVCRWDAVAGTRELKLQVDLEFSVSSAMGLGVGLDDL